MLYYTENMIDQGNHSLPVQAHRKGRTPPNSGEITRKRIRSGASDHAMSQLREIQADREDIPWNEKHVTCLRSK